jgi:hypothetical protein
MVESAENMALINDYIVESTYEVYNESIINQKMKDKFSNMYTVFMYTIKKAIEKFKGYFLTLKRKLTVAMAKALKFLGKKIIVKKYKHSGEENDKELNTYVFDRKKYNELCDFINSSMNILSDIKRYNNNDYTKVKDDFNRFINTKNNDTGSVLLTKITYKIRLAESNEYLVKKIKEIFKDVDTIMNEFYDRIMKSFDNSILELKKEEKETNYTLHPDVIKTRYKAISNAIHIANYIKYKSSQLVASACLKMYKKSFSEVMKINDKGNPVKSLNLEKEDEIYKAQREKMIAETRKQLKEWNKANKNKNIIKMSINDDLDTIKSKLDKAGKDDVLEL